MRKTSQLWLHLNQKYLHVYKATYKLYFHAETYLNDSPWRLNGDYHSITISLMMVCNDPLIPVFHQSGTIWGMVIFVRGHGADCVFIVSLFSLCEALSPQVGCVSGWGDVTVEVR